MNQNHTTVKVDHILNDYISDILFIDEFNKLIVTCWDGSVVIFAVDYDSQVVKEEFSIKHARAVLSCSYVMKASKNGYNLYIGDVQGTIAMLDMESEAFVTTANTDGGRKAISHMCSWQQFIYCGSWDCHLRVVDGLSNKMIDNFSLGDDFKILRMDCSETTLICASTQSRLKWFELPLGPHRDGHLTSSGLKYQTRDVKLTPDLRGLATSSIDGRVAIEPLLMNSDSERYKFAFRCHRQNYSDMQMVYPVNSICFVPGTPLLYTGGSDGCVVRWNIETRRKSKQFDRFDENSVVKITHNGKALAVATSDDSFKTHAAIDPDIELGPSNVYVIFE